MSPIIETRQLTHLYSAGTPFEHPALTDVDFSAQAGEYLAIIGHTGSRKIHPDPAPQRPAEAHLRAGAVWMARTSGPTRPEPAASAFRWGWCSSTRSTSCLKRRYTRTSPSARRTWGWTRRRSTAGCGRPPGLSACWRTMLDKSPFELSGGQKRRVAIAGVIAMEPQVLILDEPTAGPGPGGLRSRSWQNIRDLPPASKNATIILVSHSMEEVARKADRLVVIYDGTHSLLRHVRRRCSPTGEELEQHGPRRARR